MSSSIPVQRHSARDFSDRPVALDTLRAILTEAQLAPSWENAQPWKVYLATGKTAQHLRQSHQDLNQQGTKSWTEVVPPKDWATLPQANITAWQQNMQQFYTANERDQFVSRQRGLFNAPAIVYLTMPKNSSAYSAYDLGAFGYGILLAATRHGVSGVPAYELVRYPDEIREAFTIPDDEAIFMGIALGYPQTDSRVNALRPGRSDLNDILQVRD